MWQCCGFRHNSLKIPYSFSIATNQPIPVMERSAHPSAPRQTNKTGTDDWLPTTTNHKSKSCNKFSCRVTTIHQQTIEGQHPSVRPSSPSESWATLKRSLWHSTIYRTRQTRPDQTYTNHWLCTGTALNSIKVSEELQFTSGRHRKKHKTISRGPLWPRLRMATTTTQSNIISSTAPFGHSAEVALHKYIAYINPIKGKGQFYSGKGSPGRHAARHLKGRQQR